MRFQDAFRLRPTIMRLDDATRLVIDASENGEFLAKLYNEVFNILEWISSNNHQRFDLRATQGK